MALKFQLVNNMFGALVIQKNDPVGINDITQTIKRSEEFEGIVYEIILDVEFIKEGRRFIKQCYEFAGGIDALVVVNIYEYDTNTDLWELYYAGKINYQRYDLGEVDVVVTLEQLGPDRAVTNLMKMEVDIQTPFSENGSSLPTQVTGEEIMLFHSKAILKEFTSTPQNSGEFQQLDVNSFTLPAVILDTDRDIGFIAYGQIDNSTFKFQELETAFTTPFGFECYSNIFATDQLDGAGTDEKYIDLLTNGAPNNSAPIRNPILDITEQGVTDIILQIKMKAGISAYNTGGDVDLEDGTSGVLGHCEVYVWCEHRDKNNVVKFIEKVGQWDMSTGQSDYETKNYSKVSVDFQVGDKLYVYTTYRVWGRYEHPTQPDPTGVVHHDFTIQVDHTETFFTVKSQTVTPASEVRTFLIYEAVERCLQFYTNLPTIFYSNLLGRTDIGYNEDGEASLIALTSGNWLRGKSNWETNIKHKKLFASLKDLLEFINAIQCIGFGFETVDIDGKLIGTDSTGLPYGTRVFRLEKRSHFYRKEKILSLGKVYNVRKHLDPNRYYNLFEHGYSGKLDIKLKNAVDEFNTLRRSRIPIINTKNELKVSTKMRVSGYQIEVQRRLATSSEDSNQDDENFAVSVVRDGGGYRPKRDDGYEEINNVLEPATGYNYDWSPARIRPNWFKVIAACLIRHLGNKTLYFNFGEVNYRMSTRKTGELELLSEDSNADLSGIIPDYDPEIYELKGVRFTKEQVKLIQRNPYGYIEFEDQFGEFMYGFIDNNAGVDQDPNKRQAELNLLKVHNPLMT